MSDYTACSLNCQSFIINVTTSASTPVLLPYNTTHCRIINKGTGYAYMALASTSTQATVAGTTSNTTSVGILPSAVESFSVSPGAQYLSAIGDASTTLHVHLTYGP